jgi:hypothetical protein
LLYPGDRNIQATLQEEEESLARLIEGGIWLEVAWVWLGLLEVTRRQMSGGNVSFAGIELSICEKILERRLAHRACGIVSMHRHRSH